MRDGGGRDRVNSGGPVHGGGGDEAQEEVRDVARSAYFDLLRQLQRAVQTIILTASVSNSCVRCSDGQCWQLFRLVRSCLLAGCRRFEGSNPAVDDLLFLLIVPEFIGTFGRDLDFVAYLCINHAAATFVKQLIADVARAAHFYVEFAIMRDEELHGVFVSSLMAIENVTFRSDLPHLAQQCLKASLQDLRLQPVLWAKKRNSSAVYKDEDMKTIARPDSVSAKSELASRIGRVVNRSDLFGAFIAPRGGVQPPARSVPCREEAVSPSPAAVIPSASSPRGDDCEEAAQAVAGHTAEERRVDPTLDDRAVTFAEMCASLREGNPDLSEVEMQKHWENLQPASQVAAAGPQAPQSEEAATMSEGECAVSEATADTTDTEVPEVDSADAAPAEALLKASTFLLCDSSRLLVLEEEQDDPEQVPDAEAEPLETLKPEAVDEEVDVEGVDEPEETSAPPVEEAPEPIREEAVLTGWRAADLATPVVDAFGLDTRTNSEPVPECSISLRDLVRQREVSGIGAEDARRPSPISPRRRIAAMSGDAQAEDSEPRLHMSPGAFFSTSEPSSPSRLPKSRSRGTLPDEDTSPTSMQDGGPRGSTSTADGDEAVDRVAALEQMWLESRRNNAQSLMRLASEGPLSPRLGERRDGLSHLGTGQDALLRVSLQRGALTHADLERRGPGSRGSGGSNASSRGSRGSASSGGPRNSTPPSMSVQEDDAMSEVSTSTEQSSALSVSTLVTSASLMEGHQGPHAGSDPFGFPHSTGVHLEWMLKMKPRLDKGTQVALQRGLCPGCKDRLPPLTLFNAPRYCHYLNCYFCTNCHLGDERVIPARVAERWDFELKKVCRDSAAYLDRLSSAPLIAITCIKRTKVSSQAVLTDLHNRRQKLSRIKDIVAHSQCAFRQSLEAELLKLDAHVAEGHDLYSLQDLWRIESRGRSCELFVNVAQITKMGEEHVRSCETCQNNAHYCPICASSVPLFKFEIDDFYKCEACQAVYHRRCFKRAGSECPLCLKLRVDERRPSIAAVRPR